MKYEGVGVKLPPPIPPIRKPTLKKSSLIRVNTRIFDSYYLDGCKILVNCRYDSFIMSEIYAERRIKRNMDFSKFLSIFVLSLL